MKSPYVSELQPNQIITATFLVQHKDIRQKKTGEPYLSLVLGDRTGEIDAKMWDNAAEVMYTFERDDFLKVRGLLQVFQNRLQLTVHKLQKQTEELIDLTDYFPTSRRNGDEMMAELFSIVRGIGNAHLRQLLLLVLEDPDVCRRLRIAPAAKSIHHAYLGGLLEHILSVCTLARVAAGHYPFVDLDLLLAGVVLHDIGKIWELTYDRSFGYTSQGQLLGHMLIAVRMIGDKARQMEGFPPKLQSLLEHMIISHHGELEYGSPKTPLFPEALLLHHLDNMDSKMECMRAALEKDRLVEGEWTSYVGSLERPVLKMNRFLAASEESKASATIAGATVTAKPAPEVPNAPPKPAVPTANVPPSPAPPHQQPAPRPTSILGEKLLGALRRNG
ncbi:MAG TPA: OB-fold nucleic acid binding domain-containing protein [Bryobacteraceae bacterium]|nr:OB-fold nucleic acid binding domain-containing protein [Bryobacteraceae bacterium]